MLAFTAYSSSPMHVLTWLFTAVLIGVNLHALVELGWVLLSRVTSAPQRRTWAIRCAASALGFVALSWVTCGIAVANGFSYAERAPPDRAEHLARGISEAMNRLAFGAAGSASPCLATVVLRVLARRAAPPT